MDWGVIGPVVVLVLILMIGPFIIIWDGHERKLKRQVALVTSLTTEDGASPEARSIRREKVRFQGLRDAARALACYDPDFAEAYTVPIPLVLIAGPVIGLAAGLFASTVLPAYLCVAVFAIVTVFAVRGLFSRQRDRYQAKLRRQLPDVLQFVVSAVRAGFPVAMALRGITSEAPEPTRGQFLLVANEVAVGHPVNEALLNLFYRTRVTEYGIFAVTLAVQTKSGGHLAETLQTLADTVRERIKIGARAKALAGEGTVSATVLSILPVVTGIALSLIQPGYLEPLFMDPRGKRLFLVAVTSLLSGIWMMQRMIKKAVNV